MKRVFRFLFRIVLPLVILLAAIPTARLLWEGYDLYSQALENCSVQEMAQRIESQPDYTPVEELPQIYLDAVISVEDHRFYSHPGVDVLAVVRAAFNDLRTLSFAEGGSTITQQLAKNEYFTQEKTLTRKVAEAFMALKIEQELDKDTILSLYLNSINFGSGYETVAAASQGYFGKPPSQMNDWEATILAGIPNAPSAYSLDSSPTLAAQRQKQVLERMLRCGKITEEHADSILSRNHVPVQDKIYLNAVVIKEN